MPLYPSQSWYAKVSPELLERYLAADHPSKSDRLLIDLIYKGNCSNLQQEIEILSIIDHQLKISIPLERLPEIALMKEASALRLDHSG